MNADLEATLDELGPEYRTLVTRLRAPFDEAPKMRVARRETRVLSRLPRPFLIAASLLLVLGLAVLLQPRPTRLAAARPTSVYTVAYAPTEQALEIILASQRADGSWDNDFLTRQNAAALRNAPDARSQIAYRRAVRYLRFKGLSPLTDAELEARGESAAKVLAQI